MRRVWIPLKPESKEPDVKAGWQVPDYPGVGYGSALDKRLGLRLDDFIVVDCDDDAAKDAWLKHIDKPLLHTWVRKTPHGYHFFYLRRMTNLHVRAQKLLSVSPKIDLKCGVGHYVVFTADGYSTISDNAQAIDFDPAWVPADNQQQWVGEEWDEMPEGIGDNSMMSFAGTFRRWGMSESMIRICLRAINEQTMTRHPMPDKAIRRLARQAAKYSPEDAKTAMCPHCGGEVEIR